MPNDLTWTGLREFEAALRALPAELTEEASGIVLDAADAAKDAADAAYPERSGNLRKGLKVQTTSEGRYGTGARLVNVAQHAYIFEHGTQARHTDIGANRGAMPAGNVFIPAAVRQRKAMVQDLVNMMTAHGVPEVTGHRG